MKVWSSLQFNSTQFDSKPSWVLGLTNNSVKSVGLIWSCKGLMLWFHWAYCWLYLSKICKFAFLGIGSCWYFRLLCNYVSNLSVMLEVRLLDQDMYRPVCLSVMILTVLFAGPTIDGQLYKTYLLMQPWWILPCKCFGWNLMCFAVANSTFWWCQTVSRESHVFHYILGHACHSNRKRNTISTVQNGLT